MVRYYSLFTLFERPAKQICRRQPNRMDCIHKNTPKISYREICCRLLSVVSVRISFVPFIHPACVFIKFVCTRAVYNRYNIVCVCVGGSKRVIRFVSKRADRRVGYIVRYLCGDCARIPCKLASKRYYIV